MGFEDRRRPPSHSKQITPGPQKAQKAQTKPGPQKAQTKPAPQKAQTKPAPQKAQKAQTEYSSCDYTPTSMQISPYLSFNGDCEAAFRFYERCLGGTMGAMHRYGGSPMEHMAPVEWSDKIMHGSITVADLVIMGADAVPEQYETPQGFTLSLQIKGVDEAERVFRILSAGARIVMPLEKTFWAERFGVLVDRFGIKWQVNCEAA
jgi:PhnB protein